MENKGKTEKSIWEVLSPINCNEHTKSLAVGGTKLTYLSWAWAWGILSENFPKATYTVREWTDKPYLCDEILGYMVETSITIPVTEFESKTLSMRLPVMDSSNKAQKSQTYKYTTRSGERSVESATMFDINTAIMRCLTKNIAMFGLGFYIYAGEDLPSEVFTSPTAESLEEMQTLGITLKKIADWKKVTTDKVTNDMAIETITKIKARNEESAKTTK